MSQAQIQQLPAGFREMTADEGDQLDAYERVLVFDRGINRIVVFNTVSYSQHHGWYLAQRVAGETVNGIRLDDDNPEFWSEADEQSGRDRRGPQSVDGMFVAILPVDPANLMPLLAASIYSHDAVDILKVAMVPPGYGYPDREATARNLRRLDEEAQRHGAMIIGNVRPQLVKAVQDVVMSIVPGSTRGDGRILEHLRRVR